MMPGSAALILSTIAFDIFVSSAAVGIAFFVLLRRLHWNLGARALVPTLLATFAFLDLIWFPAAVASSASFAIHNAELAAFFSVAPNTPVESLLGLGSVDILWWFIQAGVALGVAYKLRLVVNGSAA
jgi:hypothetical protein